MSVSNVQNCVVQVMHFSGNAGPVVLKFLIRSPYVGMMKFQNCVSNVLYYILQMLKTHELSTYFEMLINVKCMLNPKHLNPKTLNLPEPLYI